MKWRRLQLRASTAVVGIVLMITSLQALAQAAIPETACVLQKDIYLCDWHNFRNAFDAVKTISVQSEAMDAHTDVELRRLADQLGKNVVARTDEPADLTFLMIPLNKSGLYIGPGEENLGTLRIYAGRTTNEPGVLVWAETYRGTKDIPWPSVEYYLMQQFKARLKAR
jgi:hypothetical protein